MINRAQPPHRPAKPNKPLNLVLGLLLGLFLGLVAAAIALAWSIWRHRRKHLEERTTGAKSSHSEQDQRQVSSAATTGSRVPRSLTAVARLFIFVGLWSAVNTGLSNGGHDLNIQPGVLGLPIGIGLLRHREWCRRLAWWCVWANGVFMLVLLGWIFAKAFGAFAEFNVVARILGQPVDSRIGALLTLLLFGSQVLLLPWMLLVLMNEQVRTICRQQKARPLPWLEWGTAALVVLFMAGTVRLPWPNRWQTGVYFTNFKQGQSSATPEQNFGPVIELVVTNLVDFDSGALVDMPLGVQPGERDPARYDWFNNDAAAFPWMRERGIDGFVANHGIIGVDLLAVELRPADWKRITPAQLQAELGGLDQFSAPSSWCPPTVDGTYGFKTRSSSAGILQLDPHVPRGVKIRYKLVQPSTGSDRSAVTNLSDLKFSTQGDKVMVETPNGQLVADRVELGSNQVRATSMKMTYQTESVPRESPELVGLPTSAFQIRLVALEGETDSLTETVTNQIDRSHLEPLHVLPEVLMDGRAVERAGWYAANGRTNFIIGFTEAGGQQFEALTAACLQRRIAVIFQRKILFSPIIRERIKTRRLEIPITWSRGDMERTMNGLNQMNNPVVDLRFGPEQVNVLPPLIGKWSFLNLRSNSLVTNSHFNPESRAFNDWQRKNGADVAAAAAEDYPIVVCYGMATVPAIASGLDNSSPSEVWFHWNLMINGPEAETLLAKAPDNGQDTYYFRTRDDTWGILQVVGFTENPRGVKIRYKLVQQGGDETPDGPR